MKRMLGSGQLSGAERQAAPPGRVRRVLATGLACGVAVAGLVACSGDDDDDEKGGAGGAAAPFDEEFSVLGGLAELPSTGVDLEKAMISIADLDAASQAVSLDRPADDSSGALVEWAMALTGPEPGPVFVPMAEGFNLRAGDPEEFATEVGWSINDVKAFAEIDAAPSRFTVVTGLESGALSDSLVDSGDGIRSSSDGDDFEVSLEEASAVDSMGRAIRFRQQGGAVGFGTSTPLVKAWQSTGETVADNASYADVAAALDDEDVVSAVLTTAPAGGLEAALGGRATPEQLARLRDEFGANIPEGPFDVIGIGWDAEGEVHIAYHFADADAAEAGADVLEKSWRDGTTLATMQKVSSLVTFEEADAEGSVAVITVVPVDERAAAPWEMLQQRELVFVSP